jgi:hypothetical protein
MRDDIRDILERCLYVLKHGLSEPESLDYKNRLIQDIDAALQGKPVDRVVGAVHTGKGW